MKKRILLSLLCAGAFLAQAQVTPRWLRNCAISPDGTTIAFTYKGDIYTVDSNGGEARQLTAPMTVTLYGRHVARNWHSRRTAREASIST